MIYVNFITSLFTGILSIYMVIQLLKGNLPYNETNNKLNHYWFLFAILLLSLIAIRLYHFGDFPIWYNMDEAMSTYDAYSLLLYGTDHWGNSYPTHMIAWGYTNQSAMYTYILVPFIKFFGYNQFAARLPLLILSVCGAFFLSLTIRDIFGDSMSLVAIIICAVNPWHFVQSRYGIDCNIFPHLFITGIFFFVHFIKCHKKRYLYFGTAILALTLYSYMIAVYSVPIFMLMIFIHFYKKRYIKAKSFFMNVVLFIIITTPMIILVLSSLFGITENIKLGIITIPSLSSSDRTSDILFMSSNIGLQFIANSISLFKTIFLQVDSWIWDSVEHYGTMFHAMASVMFVGIILLVSSYIHGLKKDESFIILSYLFMVLIIGVITKDVTVIRRLNVFYYLGMILICYFIYHLYSKKVILAKALVTMFIPLGMLLFFSYHHSYIGDLSSPSSITGTLPQALSKAKELNANKYYISSNCYGPNSASVAEIYTLVSHKVDPHIFLEDAYHEKYNYVDIATLPLDSQEDAVYVVTYDEKKFFDENLYTHYDYSLYYVIVPTK